MVTDVNNAREFTVAYDFYQSAPGFARRAMSISILGLGAAGLRRLVPSAGVEADFDSRNARFARDGAILFESLSTNFAAGDGNGRYDVFRAASDAVSLVSRNLAGEIAAGSSLNLREGPSGSTVFDSDAANLIPSGDTNLCRDVFVKDLDSGSVILVSRSATGGIGNRDSFSGVLSPDGRLVAFESLADNLIPGDGNGTRDLFLKDLASGAIIRIEASIPVVPFKLSEPNGQSGGASFSRDATRLLFESNASNLVAGDGNGSYDIFLFDLESRSISRISTSPAGIEANGHSFRASFTPDGSGVVFESLASNLVAGDTNGVRDVFLKDLTRGSVVRVSEGPNREQLNGASQNASAGGDRIVFETNASNAALDDRNFRRDIYVKDIATGSLTRLSTGAAGEGNGDSWNGRLSDDGGHLLFDSEASNLVADDRNARRDIFVADLDRSLTEGTLHSGGPMPAGTLYFTSDLPLERWNALAPPRALGTIELDLVADAGGAGRIGWQFAAGPNVSSLAAGEVVTEAHLVQLTDVGEEAITQPILITLIGANDSPAAVDDTLRLDAGQRIDLSTLLANDSDPDHNDSLRLLRVEADGLLGSISHDPASDTWIYDAGSRTLAAMPFDTAALEELRYTVVDRNGAEATATAHITVDGIWDANGATRGDDFLAAGSLDAVLYGWNGNDRLEGSTGDDLLDGGSGQDVLVGGAGNDVFVVDYRGDSVVETANDGYDTIRTALSSYRLAPNVEALESTGLWAGFEGVGNGLDNRLLGTETSADRLYGLEGNDELLGRGGTDLLEGGYGDDRLDGGAGSDTLIGGPGADIFVLRRGETAGDELTDYSRTSGDRVELVGWGPDTRLSLSGVHAALTDPLDGHVESFTVSGDLTPAGLFFG